MLTILMGSISSFFCILQKIMLEVFNSKKEKLKDVQTLPNGNILCVDVTQSISLLSSKKKTSTAAKRQEKSLVVLIGWLSAQRKHTDKYADFWLAKGFDVLTVNFTVWQLLWPVRGTQVVAADTLKFLDQDKSYSKIILHGFSAGGYEWAEVMVQMLSNLDRYQHILDRIVGQVWDSVTDLEEVSKGISRAVFPKNKFMASLVRKYMLFHLRLFDKVATRYYSKASQRFHTNIVKSPALLIFSKTDPIGTESTNKLVTKHWERRGIKVNWRVFEKSPHVGHFKKYPKEYIAALHGFLDSLMVNNDIQSSNEEIAEPNKINS